ncbi:MAG: relaxase/mobilization nuclease domain-containing protein [Lachnospiraceae bacterium]|nr:relaxase/mobilization nuclease domain-containing protein [Lachnospiraceae bacterium]
MPVVIIKNEGYKRKEDLFNLICYIAEGSEVVSGYGITLDSIDSVIREFEYVKRQWNKAEEGRRQARHFIVSFEKDEFPLNTIIEIAWRIGALYGYRFQVFYGIHTETEHTHIHFALNTVSFMDGKMISEGPPDLEILKNNIMAILKLYKNEYRGGKYVNRNLQPKV